MRLALSLLGIVVGLIAAAWWWLGAPVRMPPAPVAADEKLYCVSYTPFRGLQSPFEEGLRVDPQQIDDDLARLSRLTGCVRTYSTRNGIDQVPQIAARYGMQVIQGIWLGGEQTTQERDIVTAIGLAKAYPQVIRAMVVGNEVLLRGEMTPGGLASIIRRVKAEIPQPVTYADVWEFWLRYREVYDAVDFVTIHILPYWEDFPIPARNAASHIESIRRKVAAAFPAKEILIGETGWPSAGRMREGALPSPANQARVLHDVLNVAKQQGYHVNLIEAFDQPWKRRLEGTVGGHWGLLGAERREPKFSWGVAVSNHPQWRLQAAGGIALAVLVFAAAFSAKRRRGAEAGPAVWPGVAAMALVAGILIGWAVENVPLESLTAGDWLRSLTMVGLGIVAPLIGAAALVRGGKVPALARMLGPAARRPQGVLDRALGLTLMLLAIVAVQVGLGLAFDPRYKDFSFAPLTAATVPYLILALHRTFIADQDVLAFKQLLCCGTAETLLAGVLAACAVYIVPNESLANWQALWLAAVFVMLAAALWAVPDAPGSE